MPLHSISPSPMELYKRFENGAQTKPFFPQQLVRDAFATPVEKRKQSPVWPLLNRFWWGAMMFSLTLNLLAVTRLPTLLKLETLSWATAQSCSVVLPEMVTDSKETLLADSKPRVQEQQWDQGNELTSMKDISISSNSGSRTSSKDAVINFDHGDPTMYESFWRAFGEEGTITIPGWQTMSYFSDVSEICWFLEPTFAKEIRRLHRLVGNAIIDDRHIVIGTGSTQLFQAALFALSPSDSTEPMSVVAALPYYSSYPSVTDYLRSNLFRWAGDANAFTGNKYIELVCSPNNPDGFIRNAVLSAVDGKTIHDHAYYWPQYTAITGAADHQIMLFTVSKSTGHAGTRLGWALVKDAEVAKRMTKFIELNTIGVSKDSQLRAARILKLVTDGYKLSDADQTKRFFHYGRRKMSDRWQRLRESVRKLGIFSLPDFPLVPCSFMGETVSSSPAFAWLKCEREDIEDCEVFLKRHNILTRNGRHFGVAAKYVRISMLDREEMFDLFIERLSSIR